MLYDALLLHVYKTETKEKTRPEMFGSRQNLRTARGAPSLNGWRECSEGRRSCQNSVPSQGWMLVLCFFTSQKCFGILYEISKSSANKAASL